MQFPFSLQMCSICRMTDFTKIGISGTKAMQASISVSETRDSSVGAETSEAPRVTRKVSISSGTRPR
eukprot:9632513-Heterocapsa_arctica.AAC.1